ncbi:MAG: efflux RND transporter periplasmic adaptor subunit [Acidobacteriota bacterium]
MTPASPRALFFWPSALLATALLFTGCSKATSAKETSAKEPPPGVAAAASNPLEIDAGPGLLERIRIGEPSWGEVGASLTVAGRVDVDATRITRIGSPVMGRITSLEVQEGQQVSRGQLLALLNSTGLSGAQLELLKSLSQKLVAQRAVERAQILLKSDVIGSAELQRREAEFAQATAELDAARDELELLGMPETAIAELEKTRAIKSIARITASMDGTLLQRKVALGQVIQPADTVFDIADLSSVWLMADVPEQEAGNLERGHDVEAEIAAFPGHIVRGKLSYVSATVDPDTRTVRVHMDLPNPRHRYKPAMLATMILKDRREKKQLVPVSAVVREDDTDHVFVQLDNDTFVLRPVVLGPEFGGSRVLLEGLRGGEKIVTDGAFHLNNERRRQSLRGSES